ncbi:hypothetical protein LOTGIDRAFT_232981 [Lottia gigantea]|uniref:Uncharacterized protein n=1 Tax=Lottia gigantea TaxID=225164 RepID=V4ABP7_LOTGI|nr:hypothetical protein LOTGIDRAFT_232981 [Lottia gigantea]ESO92505.1 hypothetical protein LOTGIDRAFT_232981 [Lottia gigantea]
MASRKGLSLAKTDFPLYCVRSLGDRHFLIAGGGGQAKTGIPNAIEIYELKLIDGRISAVSVGRHDTGTQAVMNCTSFYDGRNHQLAVGQDEMCCLYSLKYSVIPVSKKHTEENSTKNRKKEADTKKKENEEKTDNKKAETKQIKFDVTEIKSIPTDFDKEGGFQKVVRFSPNHKFFATGGVDGHLRVWKYPDCDKIFDIKAHDSDIDDIDISPAGDRIATVSRDHTGCVWKSDNGEEVIGLVNSNLKGYRYRCCRYGLVEGKQDKCNLYTISIPITRSSKPLPCYITTFDHKKYSIRKQAKAGTEVLSSLAVSEDGIYLGVGTLSGSVAVYISFSLQKLYYVKAAHGIFVTGVEFMSNSESCQAITGDKDFTLLSISADNTVKLHQVNPRGSISALWIIIGFVILVYFLFWLLAELGV